MFLSQLNPSWPLPSPHLDHLPKVLAWRQHRSAQYQDDIPLKFLQHPRRSHSCVMTSTRLTEVCKSQFITSMCAC